MEKSILQDLVREISSKSKMPQSQYQGPPDLYEPISSRLDVMEDAALQDRLTREDIYPARVVYAGPSHAVSRAAQALRSLLVQAVEAERKQHEEMRRKKGKEGRKSEEASKANRDTESSEEQPATVGEAITTFMQDAFSMMPSKELLNAPVLAEICVALYQGLDNAEKTPGLAAYFRSVVGVEAQETLIMKWEEIFSDWNAAMEKKEPVVAAISFRELRSISTFYGYLHSLGVVGTDTFTTTVNEILHKYALECLELRMVVAIDLLSRGLFTSLPYPLLSPSGLWSRSVWKKTRALVECGDKKAFHNAVVQLQRFVQGFAELSVPIERADGSEPAYGFMPFQKVSPSKGSKEFEHLERFCRDVEGLIMQQIGRL